MYPSDFPAEVPSPTLEPTLLAALVLLAVGLAAAAFWLGQIHAARALARERADACRRIHEHVAGKCKAAMGAGWHEVQARANDLTQALDKTLGPLLDLGGSTAPLAAAVKATCEGRPAAADGHGHDAHGHGDHGHADSHGEDHGHGGDHEALTVTETGVRVRIGKAETVIVQGAPAGGGAAGGHPPAAPGVDPAAIRAAVGAFSDHWKQPSTLEALIKLQGRLNAPALPKGSSSH